VVSALRTVVPRGAVNLFGSSSCRIMQGHGWGGSAGPRCCVSGGDESALGTYRPRGLFGYVDLPSPPSGLHGLAAPSSLDDAVSECLLRNGRHGHIVADLWHALQENVWLIARRATTLDQLVQAGVRLIVEGHNGYLTAIDEIASSLGLGASDSRIGEPPRGALRLRLR
jgi:hypothetical protein